MKTMLVKLAQEQWQTDIKILQKKKDKYDIQV